LDFRLGKYFIGEEVQPGAAGDLLRGRSLWRLMLHRCLGSGQQKKDNRDKEKALILLQPRKEWSSFRIGIKDQQRNTWEKL
jgi:hypothetical protein